MVGEQIIARVFRYNIQIVSSDEFLQMAPFSAVRQQVPARILLPPRPELIVVDEHIGSARREGPVFQVIVATI